MLYSELDFWLWILVWAQVYPSKVMYLHKAPHTKPNRFISLDGDSFWFPLRLQCQHPALTARSHFTFCIYCLQIGWEAGSICGEWRIFRTITVLVYWQGAECLQGGTGSVHCMKGEYLLLSPAVWDV